MSNSMPDVSRETSEKLRAFAAMVEKWTARINLISKSSIPEIWERHILDSAQLFRHAPSEGRWVDLGSGGGFPGIVSAILAEEFGDVYEFVFVESDQRKCVFLRTALRELGLLGNVQNERIEALAPQNADIISARALADLPKLLGLAVPHMNLGGVALLQKGHNWKAEVQAAQLDWSFEAEPIASQTEPGAVILKIKDIQHV